jgi:hypothetical protein
LPRPKSQPPTQVPNHPEKENIENINSHLDRRPHSRAGVFCASEIAFIPDTTAELPAWFGNASLLPTSPTQAGNLASAFKSIRAFLCGGIFSVKEVNFRMSQNNIVTSPPKASRFSVRRFRTDEAARLGRRGPWPGRSGSWPGASACRGRGLLGEKRR